MASTIVFLLYGCVLLPLLAANDDSKPCVFPFTYEQISYSSCTSKGTKDEKLWCATTPDYNNDRQWKWCTTEEYGGNSGGKPCEFPFIYLKKTYYSCTSKMSKKPWCATTGSYDRDRKWSYCADTRLNAGPCVFPFIYNNTSHTTCVTQDSPDKQPWCSQTKNYDVDKKRIPCETSEGNCEFPFTYKGKQYCSCTTDGTLNKQLWCATTSSYDKHRKWRTCVLQEYGGNSNGKTCVIPFIYKEKTYRECTSEDEPSGRLWCATTSNYDMHAEWAFCRDPAPLQDVKNGNKTCTIPFTYKGTTYFACTKDGSMWGRSWCSLTSNYDENKEWMYCDFSDREKGCSQQS